jgi:hypothetical protein
VQIPPLDLDVDLMLLGTPERFETFCLSLTKRELPGVFALSSGSWDGGRDFTKFTHLMDYRNVEGRELEALGDIVWQCKFVRHLNATTKKSIRKSIHAVRDHAPVPVKRWILCIPVDPTEPFIHWLRQEVEPLGWRWEVWGKKELLERLEKHSDLAQTFFYPVYEQLRRHFAIDNIELFEVRLADECEWSQGDPHMLAFSSHGTLDPDLVLDLIVQNSGTIDASLLGIQVHVGDCESNLHGIPGRGLLFSQITYSVSIHRGEPGKYEVCCEPPLLVRAASKERFKIRLTDTGYAWKGTVQILLDYGKGRLVPLPAMRIYT